MSVIDKAAAQFRERLSGELKFVECPEWGEKDKPLKVYYKPAINFKAQEKIYALVNAGKSSEAVCQTLIIRALDEEGNHLFRQTDMPKFMHEVDPEIVAGIVTQMQPDEDDVATLKKS